METKPRPVSVHQITLLAWEPPRLSLEVVCGRGTYIRSLAADLGERLGCGAALEALARLRVGPFKAEEALGLAEAEAALRDGRLGELGHLAPLDALFPGWLALHLYPDSVPRALAGGTLGPGAGTWGWVPPTDQEQEAPFLPSPPRDRAVAYGPDGRIVALLAAEGEGLWRPRKVLVPREPLRSA